MSARTLVINLIFIIGMLSTTLACAQGQPGYKIVEPVQDILKKGMALLYYEQDYLRFSEDLVAYDAAGKKISKDAFLKQLCTGLYLPLRLTGDVNGLAGYRLYKLDMATDKKFNDLLTSLGNEYYNCYKYEGQKFPDFSFVGLDGHNHDNKTLKGKFTVINFWFIKCEACNEEMPQLNGIKAAYNGRSDIQFYAVAFDKIAALKNFVLKKKFDFTLCQMPENKMEQTVGINEYPTTFIIDKNGIILKVIHEPQELNTALKKFVKSI